MAMIDFTKRFCIYETMHVSGHYVYYGKGQTAKIQAGKYFGSGTAFKAAIKHPDFGLHTWTVKILDTFDTEDEAYEAEAKLVTIDLLRHPGVLNEQAGGRKGRNQNRAALVRRDRAEERAEARALATVKRKAREEATKRKLADLRAKLKSKNV